MPKFDHFDYFHRVWLIFFCVFFFCLVGISPNKKPILNNPSRSTLSKIWLTNPLTTRIYWVTLEICLLTRDLKKNRGCRWQESNYQEDYSTRQQLSKRNCRCRSSYWLLGPASSEDYLLMYGQQNESASRRSEGVETWLGAHQNTCHGIIGREARC